MNQFCCQKGKSEWDALLDSPYTIRVGPEVVEDDDAWWEEDFLRDKLGDPEEATVRFEELSRALFAIP